MFFAIRCDTPQKDIDVLNSTCKLTLGGASYDDDDERNQIDVGGSSRRKRCAIENLQRESKKRFHDLKEMQGKLLEFLSESSVANKGRNSDGPQSKKSSSYTVLSTLVTLSKEQAALQ